MPLKVNAQRGRFFPGFLVGTLVGLVLALGVALYVSKVPSPFVDKVPTRSAEQDAADAEKSRNWDPNAPLAGKTDSRAATGTVSTEPARVPASAPDSTAAAASGSLARAAAMLGIKPDAPASASTTGTSSSSSAAPAPSAKASAAPLTYYVQVGAYTRSEDAETQRAKLAMNGLTARISERDQGGKPIYRVRLGPFPSRDDAEAVRDQAASSGYSEASLVPIPR